jgi:nicotinamidase-related amidase
VLKNAENVVNKARNHGFKIIHAPLVIDPKNKKGWLAYLTFGKVFTKGKSKSKISPGFFKSDDLLVKGRYAFDSFIGSNLEEIIKKEDIQTVFLCGFTTDQCVAKTMSTMSKKSIKAFLLTDCSATLNAKLQKRVEKKFASSLISSQDLLNQLLSAV